MGTLQQILPHLMANHLTVENTFFRRYSFTLIKTTYFLSGGGGGYVAVLDKVCFRDKKKWISYSDAFMCELFRSIAKPLQHPRKRKTRNILIFHTL